MENSEVPRDAAATLPFKIVDRSFRCLLLPWFCNAWRGVLFTALLSGSARCWAAVVRSVFTAIYSFKHSVCGGDGCLYHPDGEIYSSHVYWSVPLVPSTTNQSLTVLIYLTGLPLMVLGTGLLTTLEIELQFPKLITYQLLIGAGIGMNFEGPLLALQASNSLQDTSTATATISFIRMLASAMSAVIGGVVFQNQINKEYPDLLAAIGPDIAGLFSGVEAAANVNAVKKLPMELQLVVKEAFLKSLRGMWIMVSWA